MAKRIQSSVSGTKSLAAEYARLRTDLAKPKTIKERYNRVAEARNKAIGPAVEVKRTYESREYDPYSGFVKYSGHGSHLGLYVDYYA